MASTPSDENLDSTSGDIIRPEVPKPTATSNAVQAFLVQFLRALCSNRSLREAKEMAERVHADGIALYEISEQEWVEYYGNEGRSIHRALQRSTYGFDGSYWPRVKVVGGTLIFAGSVEGLLEFWWKKDARTFIFPVVCLSITVSLGLTNLYCRSQAAHDKGWIPEGFKIRQGSGS